MSTAKSPLSPYEERALSEIERFKNDDPTWLDRITEKIHKPIEAFTNQALDNVVGDALGTVVKGLVGLINDGASWSVQEESIFVEYRKKRFLALRHGPGIIVPVRKHKKDKSDGPRAKNEEKPD